MESYGKTTSKAWIDPLVNYLKHLGVKFNFNTVLKNKYR